MSEIRVLLLMDGKYHSSVYRHCIYYSIDISVMSIDVSMDAHIRDTELMKRLLTKKMVTKCLHMSSERIVSGSSPA